MRQKADGRGAERDRHSAPEGGKNLAHGVSHGKQENTTSQAPEGRKTYSQMYRSSYRTRFFVTKLMNSS